MDITAILQTIGEIVWGPPTWAILGLCGLYLSIRTGWFQVTKFGHYAGETLGKMFKKREDDGAGDITPFQAFTTAMSATMGVGNLIGTTTAILTGGPGAVFWMWIIGFFGITTKFAEITLAVHYRETNDKGMVLGGPMMYIQKGLGWKWLAIIFCIAGSLAAFGIGNLVQVNNVAGALDTAFGLNRQVSGAMVMILVGLVIIGGVKRIGKVAEKLIPFLAIAMILGCVIVAIQNFNLVGWAFSVIFRAAFSSEAYLGGIMGASIAMAIRMGLARGIFSNEAGLGSAPIAHAAAKTDHPCRQGFWGAIEVVLDTHVVCTVVALAVLTSGAWNIEGLNATQVFMYAYSSSIFGPVVGNTIAALAILGFGLTTMLGWAFYGEKCLEYLVGTKSNLFYRISFLPVLFIGSFGVVPVWAISDILNAFMAVPNIIGVIFLGGIFTAITKSYFAGERYVPYDEDNNYYKGK